MKHSIYNLYNIQSNTYNFSKRNQEILLFLFQVDEFAAIQGVVLVSQRVLLLAESFLCPPFHRAEWGFLLNLPSLSRQTLLVNGTIHISNNILDWLLRLFKSVNLFVTLQEKQKSLMFKWNLTYGLLLGTLIITSFKGLKSLSLQAKITQKHCTSDNMRSK